MPARYFSLAEKKKKKKMLVEYKSIIADTN